MNLKRLAFSAMIASACFAGPTMAQDGRSQGSYRQAGYSTSYFADEQASPSDAAPASSGCNTCDSGSCDSGACDSMGCGCGGGLLGGGLLGDCCLGEPWKLFDGDNCYGINIAGWSNIGYHTSNNVGLGLLSQQGGPANFNNYADKVQLQQQWIYAERIADGSCGLDWGGRIDYLYGTDGPDTQAFGMNNNHWDNNWNNGGAYGHAIPQLYGEVAYGATSVKLGHFFTIIGQEVVAATGNFFYSRQFTFYNAEPFTHTGALATTVIDDDTTLWNGYVMGWDSGFRDNGDTYIGGFKRNLTDKTNVIYTTAWGRFSDDVIGTGFAERGNIHSGILTTQVSDNLTHILQMDYLDTRNAGQVTLRQTNGLINYFIYKVNDCWSVGSRSEWFNYTSPVTRNGDLYNQTLGLNYRPSANLIFRPEVRWVWDKEPNFAVNENGKSSQATFGTDMIFTF